MRFAYQRRPLGISCSNVRSADYIRDRNHSSAAKRPHVLNQGLDDNSKLIGTSRRSLLATPALICGCGFCRGATADDGGGGPHRNAFLDQVFAENMYTGMNAYEEAIAPLKTKLFSRLKPASPSTSSTSSAPGLDLVEIGVGTGPSLKYYPREEYPNLSITAIDPNNFMLPYLYKNMDALGWSREGISWQLGTAEALPLEDSSTDAVVCTLVLCSVSDVEKAVKEAKRVLRPGGQFLFIEHTIAQPNASLLFKISQRFLNPLQRALADGCNLTRDPLPAIENAGFSSVDAMRFEVEGMGLIAPHVAGIAIA